MRTGSPELNAALEAGQRTYDVQVRLGGRDVTDEVTSWSVERGSDTGLPAEVATPTGSTAAAASLSLSGQGQSTAAARYSPWAPRVTADITRPGQSCVLEWGLAEERLQSIRGRVRTVRAHSRSGVADVSVLDGSELMRGRAWLPPAVLGGSGGSNIHTQWVIDHALRESGIYTSPPMREGAIFFASMHASREANRGIRQSTTGITGYYPQISPWTAAPSTRTGNTPTDGEWSATYAPQKRVISQANTLMVEWWVRCPDPGTGPYSQTRLLFASRPASESGRTETPVTVSFDPATRQLRAQVGSGSATWTAPASTSQTGNFKVAFMVTLTTTSAPVTVRGWLYQPSGQLYATPTYSGAAPVWGYLDTITVTATGPVECVGVTPVTGTIDVVQGWRRGAVLELITAAGHNGSSEYYGLRGLPEVSGTWWELVKQIATDNLAYVWFDEDGVLRLRPYDFVTPDSPLIPDPDLTVTAERDIADISVEEEIDSVANRIEVGWSPLQQNSSQQTELYEYNTVFSIQSGATSELRIDFQGRPWGMRAPALFAGATHPTQTQAGSVVKFVTSTGTLAPVECELVHDDGHPLFRFHNRGGSIAYSALTSALADPSFRPVHQEAQTPSAAPRGRQNLASIARYGVQALAIGASPWLQNVVWADQISLRLVAWTAWPVPLTGQIAILPDPRIQIGDVVHIQDREGTRIDGVYRVLGYTVSGSGPAVTMALDVRPLSRPAQPQDSGLATEPILDPTVSGSLPG